MVVSIRRNSSRTFVVFLAESGLPEDTIIRTYEANRELYYSENYLGIGLDF